MAAIDIDPIIITDATVTAGDNDYEAHVSKVQLTPTTPVAVWQGMTPAASIPRAGAPSWVANIDYAQDETTADSFSQYLLTNAGKIVPFVFKPAKTGDASYAADVLIIPGPVGDQVGKIATGSVALPIKGQPVRTAGSTGV